MATYKYFNSTYFYCDINTNNKVFYLCEDWGQNFETYDLGNAKEIYFGFGFSDSNSTYTPKIGALTNNSYNLICSNSYNDTFLTATVEEIDNTKTAGRIKLILNIDHLYNLHDINISYNDIGLFSIYFPHYTELIFNSIPLQLTKGETYIVVNTIDSEFEQSISLNENIIENFTSVEDIISCGFTCNYTGTYLFYSYGYGSSYLSWDDFCEDSYFNYKTYDDIISTNYFYNTFEYDDAEDIITSVYRYQKICYDAITYTNYDADEFKYIYSYRSQLSFPENMALYKISNNIAELVGVINNAITSSLGYYYFKDDNTDYINSINN